MKFPISLALLLAAFCTTAPADSHVVKVEETWQLSVGEPNDSRNAPQITMVMSPFSDLESDYFIFELNHRTKPSYVAGGMQVQRWFNGQHYCTHNNWKSGTMNSTGETAVWTQELTIDEGKVTFQIRNGQSLTWGQFGGQGHLKSTATTGLPNLNSYRADISINESGIGYAGNRVSSLILQRIKWTMSDGQTYELNAPIDIDADLDPWNDEE